MPAPGGFTYRYIKEGRELWPAEGTFQQLDDLYWRNINRRYVLIRGDTSSGKSTILNILVGSYLLRAGENQTTSCITEIRPIPDDGHADLTRRLVLLDWDGIEARLRYLEQRDDPDLAAYRRAAQDVREKLGARGLKLGATIKLETWEQELDLGTGLADRQRHSIIAIERVIIPVTPAGNAAMKWAADCNISFLDLPGSARGNVIVESVLAEAAKRYVPVVKLRIWGADRHDGPSATEDETLVINQLDKVPPGADQTIFVERSARAHHGTVVAMSAAADVPDAVDLGLPVSRFAAAASLRAWMRWLDQQEDAASPQGAAGTALLDALKTTLGHPDGGIGVLVDIIDSAVRMSGDQPSAEPSTTRDAVAVLERLRDLRDRIGPPPTERDAEMELRLRAEEERQHLENDTRAAAQRAVYGKPGSPPWPLLLGSGGSDQALTAVRQHLLQAEEQARQEVNLPGDPVLAGIAEPTLRRLTQLTSRNTPGGARLTWVDVARMRWEYAAILADRLVSELERDSTAAPSIDRAQVAAKGSDYNKRVVVINAAIAWVSSLAAEPSRT